MQSERRGKTVQHTGVPVAAPPQKDSLTFLASLLSRYGMNYVTAEDLRKAKYSDWLDVHVNTGTASYKQDSQPQDLVPQLLNQKSGFSYSCDVSLYSSVLQCDKQWRVLHGLCVMYKTNWHPLARAKLDQLYEHSYSIDFVRDTFLQQGAVSSTSGPFLSMQYSPLSSNVLQITEQELESLKEVSYSQMTLWRIVISATPRTLLLAILFLQSVGVSPLKQYFFEVNNDLEKSNLYQPSHMYNMHTKVVPRNSIGHIDLLRVLHTRIQAYLQGKTEYQEKAGMFLPYFLHRQGQIGSISEQQSGVLRQMCKNKETSKIQTGKLCKVQKAVVQDIQGQPLPDADTPAVVSIVGPSVELYGVGVVARLMDGKRRDAIKEYETEHQEVQLVPAYETVIMNWGISVLLHDKEKGSDIFGKAQLYSLANISKNVDTPNIVTDATPECMSSMYTQLQLDSIHNGHHLLHYHCTVDTNTPCEHCHSNKKNHTSCYCQIKEPSNTMGYMNSIQLFQQLHNTCTCTDSRCNQHATSSYLLNTSIQELLANLANKNVNTAMYPSKSIEGIKFSTQTKEVKSITRSSPVCLTELSYLTEALDRSSVSAILTHCGKVTSRKQRNLKRLNELQLPVITKKDAAPTISHTTWETDLHLAKHIHADLVNTQSNITVH